MVQFLLLSDIEIAPNRQRRNFNLADLNDLGDSISRLGLMHPIVIRKVDGKPTLVAGERRFRAISDLYDLGGTFTYAGEPVEYGCVPCTDLGELHPLAAMEAELEENIRRVDLTWQERAAATAALMDFRKAQAAQDNWPAPTTATIAEEVRGSKEGAAHESTRRELILAKHLNDPAVKSAKTLDEAFKALKKREDVARNVQLAESVGRVFSISQHQAHNADSREWLAAYAGPLFDVVVTDPPYGMGADEFGDSGGMADGAHFYEDSAKTVCEIMSWLPDELHRLTKPDAHVYIFCDIDWFPIWKGRMTDAGWKVFRTPLIWHKPAAFRAPWPEHGPQRKYEVLLYAIKGDRRVNKLYPDVISCPADSNLGHPAQKPVALYEDLLRRSARPGDTVLDPFSGSGPIFPAANALMCTAVGVEMDVAAYALGVKRITELGAQTSLEL